MLTIGSLQLANRIISAPMAGVTDRAFRDLAREFGCGLTFSEMISDMGLCYTQQRTLRLADVSEEDGPVAVQIFGSDPETMGRGAAILVGLGAAIIDINMGCPTPKIVKNREGAALLTDLHLARSIIREVKAAVSLPVTVKMRKGWHDDEHTYIELGGIAEEEGAAAVTLHPRSRSQFFSGQAEWSAIKILKQQLAIPVIGNGDIMSASDACRMLEETNCDAIMIGRGAMGNPFLFREAVALVEEGTIIEPATIEERIGIAIRHLDLACRYKGEMVGVREMRKHFSWYTRGMRGAARIRGDINRADSRDELVAAIMQLLGREGN
ncbi:MAG: tRNA dihydrouridine synthase DusB [Syntrophomonadaceae bacterium]|nr:tRNA dihydrouridine synthase DusB [Syntrophomonadaceae bacterium]